MALCYRLIEITLSYGKPRTGSVGGGASECPAVPARRANLKYLVRRSVWSSAGVALSGWWIIARVTEKSPSQGVARAKVGLGRCFARIFSS